MSEKIGPAIDESKRWFLQNLGRVALYSLVATPFSLFGELHEEISTLGRVEEYHQVGKTELGKIREETLEGSQKNGSVIHLRKLGPYRINNHDLSLVGVAHTSYSFAAYEPEIRQTVKESPFIVLEYFNREVREGATPDFNIEKRLDDNTYEGLILPFFTGVGAICAQERKDIIEVNPQTIATQFTQTALLYGIPGATIISNLPGGADIFYGNSITRRALLSTLALGTSAWSWLSYHGSLEQHRDKLERLGLVDSQVPKEQQANVTEWDVLDFRDIRTAQALEKVFEWYGSEATPDQSIPLIHGAYHNGVVEYLKNPSFRDQKALSYLHFLISGNLTIRRYTFADNAWKLKEQTAF